MKKLDIRVPHELNEDKKSLFRGVIVSSSAQQNYPFLDRMVTCDEKLILCDNRRRLDQWLHYDKAPQHFLKLKLHQEKVMLAVGGLQPVSIYYHNFLDPGEGITAEKSSRNFNEMDQKARRMCPALVTRKGPTLFHNARPHLAQPTMQKLNELGYETLPHPTYSSNLSPIDYRFSRFGQLAEGEMFQKPRLHRKCLHCFHRLQNSGFLDYWHK